MKTEIHNNQTCFFDDAHHKYFVGDAVLTSVTTFIGTFFPEFEAEKVAEVYARKHGRDKEQVLAEWEAAGDEGRDKGHELHAYAEILLVNGMPNNLRSYPLDKFEGEKDAIISACKTLLGKYTFLAAEKIIFSVALGLAGTIDLLMEDTHTNDVLILDWKTNKVIKRENPWQTAKAPIDHLDACNFNEYQIQLNVYERILREEGYFPGRKFRKGLIHVPPGGPHWYKVGDMQDEVERMLTWV